MVFVDAMQTSSLHFLLPSWFLTMHTFDIFSHLFTSPVGYTRIISCHNDMAEQTVFRCWWAWAKINANCKSWCLPLFFFFPLLISCWYFDVSWKWPYITINLIVSHRTQAHGPFPFCSLQNVHYLWFIVRILLCQTTHPHHPSPNAIDSMLCKLAAAYTFRWNNYMLLIDIPRH